MHLIATTVKYFTDESCVRCHDDSMYTREDRKTQSYYASLRERVVQCEIMTELIWFEEEIDDVTAYLNACVSIILILEK